MSAAESTVGEIEAALVHAIIRFEKEYMGRGPTEVRAFIVEDMIIVRLYGVMTPAELRLAESSDGHVLVKQLRRRLLQISRPLLEQMVEQVVGSPVISLHSDISVKTGERIIVFVFGENMEKRFLRAKKRRPDKVAPVTP
ncbi:MAG: DUF2294 domain-containing protein [Anaerolineales bacterium]|nr:DUF2294 domain-containing protein [Anaerolineales bacterium]